MSIEKKQIVTSLRVDADTWKLAKIEAIKHDLTLTDMLQEAIELWVRNKKDE